MKNYKNFMLEKKRNENDTSGIVFIYDDKILLVHQHNDVWSYPKGHIEPGETKKETAIRESEEEVGVKLPKNFLKGKKSKKAHTNEHGKNYWYFVHNLTDKEFEKYFNSKYKIPRKKIQAEEITEAKFFSKKKANKIIKDRYRTILKHVKELEYA